MNRISLYILIILVFLSLSASYQPDTKGYFTIVNEQVFPYYFPEAPISIILLENIKVGFIIKSYYQRYKVIYGFKPSQEMIVKTNRDFWRKSSDFVGLSLFVRYEHDRKESTTPMPPGLIFVGNPAYGSWVLDESGNQIWQFHRAYREYPAMFMWGDFSITLDFFNKANLHSEHQKPFFGLRNEFGPDGEVTQKALSHINEDIMTRSTQAEPFKAHLKRLFSWNYQGDEVLYRGRIE